MSIKNIAIILAGGSGTRFGGEIPKQFQFLDGKRVIDYSVETFSNHKDIDCIITSPPFYQSTKFYIKTCK